MSIAKRKSEHLKICLEEDSQFRNKTTGFEEYDFIHCALPELNFDEVNTSCSFLGKELSFPFMISAITGGCSEAVTINTILGEVCAENRVAVGVGSQRAMINNPEELESFRIVREIAPTGVIIGNIGAAQITLNDSPGLCAKLVETIAADSLAVHLNPLQEILQPGGDRNFTGVLNSLELLCRSCDVPVIVKEVGCGISADIVSKLMDCGVAYVDVAGSGGTSWAAIEGFRGSGELSDEFREWGIPTARCVVEGVEVENARIIASGGLRSGVDLAKALALGAELGGAAFPVLQEISRGGAAAVSAMLEKWQRDLKMVMFLTGAGTVEEFRSIKRITKVR